MNSLDRERALKFAQAIADSTLLSPSEVTQMLAEAQSPEVDAEMLAKSLVKKGWLTPFQAKQIWKGKTQELFVNQYILLDRIGEGGMGEVYRAKHQRMGREVAIKIIRREKLDNPDAVKRFHREIRVAAQLSHENIVMAYDADQFGDNHFYAMEYVNGPTLSHLVREQGPLSVEKACNYIRQAALGLQHAHEKGMVHRDIKPSNLLLGPSEVIKILDMGLARAESQNLGDSVNRITQDGLVVGTPDYLSPEQARNPSLADTRSDIYSLGCTFYFLLTGEPPFVGGTPTEKLLRHATEKFPMPKRSDLPEGVKTILKKMTAKDPKDRYQKPEQVAVALAPFVGGNAQALLMPSPLVEPLPEQILTTTQNYPRVEVEPKTDSRFAIHIDSQDDLPPPVNRVKNYVLIGVITAIIFVGGLSILIILLISK
ncbi:MAG: serine/threonine protein kinase [Gemmataceae bacterium]|jgi:serine/threonine protein kinase|nr:serine/threonine protein kinase [Gemmataceae bacterium]